MGSTPAVALRDAPSRQGGRHISDSASSGAARASGPNARDSARLAALDGYRALAVAWVVAFHYFHYWTPSGGGAALLPDAPRIGVATIAPFGFLGVHLFFMISGFVILMTLERTRSLFEFAVRRFARLWPPLLLCGALTFFTTRAFGPEILQVSTIDYLVSMLITPPEYLNYITPAESHKWLDGAYWSLWVEVRFYAVFGLAYFAFGRRYLWGWLAFEAVAAAAALGARLSGGEAFEAAAGLMFQPFTPLFTVGVCFARMHAGRATRLDAAALGLASVHYAVMSIGKIGFDQPDIIAAVLISYAAFVLLFAALLTRDHLADLFAWTPLAKIGVASYLIYLLHQNFGLTVILLVTKHAPVATPFAAAGFAVALVLATLVLHERFERPAQRAILRIALGRRTRPVDPPTEAERGRTTS